MLKVKVHTSFLGNTGYAHHARHLCDSLSKYCDLKIRNFSVDENWPNYLTDHQKSLVIEQTLLNNGQRETHPPFWKDGIEAFHPDIEIVLQDYKHYYYFDSYIAKIKIAYLVWESTLVDPDFFDHLLGNFDYFWCPSQWQKDCMIKQGWPENRIFVVPEGVSEDLVSVANLTALEQEDYFKFFLAGRYENRKSTEEIIKTFNEEFQGENVKLVCSIENPFSQDKRPTKEKLLSKNLWNDQLELVEFPERKDYIKIMQNSHCHVSCSKAEGWGLTISDSIACGTPTIYAHNTAPIDFASEIGIPVESDQEIPNDIYGSYYQPDFKDLAAKMRFVYENFKQQKEKSLNYAEKFQKNFSWEKAAKRAFCFLFSTFNNHCFTITSHCNTEEKINALKETIKDLKNIGLPVVLYSTVSLPPEIQSSVSKYIYNSFNYIPKIKDRSIFFFRTIGDLKIKSFTPDYGFAAANQIKECLMGSFYHYNMSHVVNYDTKLTEDFFFDHLLECEKNKNGAFYLKGEKEAQMMLFSVGAKHSNLFLVDTKYDKYIKIRSGIAENFIYNILKKTGASELPSKSFKIDSSINTYNVWPTDLYENENFKLFFGQKENKKGIIDENTSFFFHSVKEKEKVTISANGRCETIMLEGQALKTIEVKYEDLQEILITPEKSKKITITEFPEKSIIETKEEPKTTGKTLIVNHSDALGDTLAWVPFVEKYRKEKKCEVLFQSDFSNILAKSYPEIQFVDKRTNCTNNFDNILGIGVSLKEEDLKHPEHYTKIPLQKVAANSLGLDYKEQRPKIHIKDKKNKYKKKYVCIATHSTAQCKYWTEEGWEKTVQYLKLLDYEVICIDKHETFGFDGYNNTIPKSAKNKTGNYDLDNRITDIYNCEFFIGLASGLSWLAWGLGKPVVMISGFSDPKSEFFTPYRVINKDVCNSCWNEFVFGQNWNWCPRNKNFECSKSISFKIVKEKIDQLIIDHKL
jgi:autotransporter strand-loop-strand O-heptosyltransferase